ncbi:hypothetical protein BBP40_004816 [Aspergillus hancockii]|nr:hypothetical protein BBP40_004816 [Aspergillus hancockii]
MEHTSALTIPSIHYNGEALQGNVLLSIPAELAGVDVGYLVNDTIHAVDGKGSLNLTRQVNDSAGPLILQNWHAVRVKWHLQNAPDGTRAVWTWGEGSSVTRRNLCSEIQRTYFAVGNLKSEETLQGVFKYMTRFFEDEDLPYRIFLRRNSYRGSGAGTAVARSFMFSYDMHDYRTPTNPRARMVFLSHGMTYNWVVFRDTTEDSWYAEGMAEHYLLAIPYRLKDLSLDEYRDALNERYMKYYTNSLVFVE